jgi:hypothetical protein
MIALSVYGIFDGPLPQGPVQDAVTMERWMYSVNRKYEVEMVE